MNNHVLNLLKDAETQSFGKDLLGIKKAKQQHTTYMAEGLRGDPIKNLVHTLFKEKIDVGVQGAAEFLLSDASCGYMDSETYMKNLDFHAPLDLPFEKCFFAAANHKNLLVVPPSDGVSVSFRVLYVRELQPGRYSFTSMARVRTSKSDLQSAIHTATYDEYISGVHDKQEINHYEWYYSLIHWCCGVVAASRAGEVTIPHRRQKTWEGDRRTDYRPSKIIYLGPKGKSNKLPQIPGAEFKRWIDAWRVRGHWRRLANGGLGRDRTGKRTVDGYTWVRPHEKGEGIVSTKTYKVTGWT